MRVREREGGRKGVSEGEGEREGAREGGGSDLGHEGAQDMQIQSSSN